MNSAKLRRDITLGLKSLMLHKLRSLLTMLGVVFGVGSVVAMLSVGEGAGQEALAQIEKLGSRNIVIRSKKPAFDEKTSNLGHSRSLEYGLLYADLARIKVCYPAIDKVVPAKIVNDEARLGEDTMEVRIVGTTSEWFELVPRKLLAGRLLNEHDAHTRASVCVIAEHVARTIMAGKSVLGQTIRIGGEAFFCHWCYRHGVWQRRWWCANS